MQQQDKLIQLVEKLRTPKVLILWGVGVIGLIVFAYFVERPLYDQIMSFLPIFVGTIVFIIALCFAIAVPLEWAIKKIQGKAENDKAD